MKQLKNSFYDCQRAKIIWRVVYVATRLTPPRSVTNMVKYWFMTIRNKDKN
jgi:hypothetical protein